MNSNDTRSRLQRLVAPAFTVFVLSALGAPAAAQDLVIEAPASHPIATTTSTAPTFDLDVTVELPQGFYTGMQLVLQLPMSAAVVHLGNASPTTGEFDNAIYNATSRTLTWNQVLPLDLTAGAGVRKFRLTGYLHRYLSVVNAPYAFSATLDGSAGDPAAPFPEAMMNASVIATGPGASLTFSPTVGSFAAYRRTSLGWGMSAETTPRPGHFSRYVFGLGNPSQARLDANTTWTIDLGDQLHFVAAGAWTTVGPPYTPSADITFDSLPTPFTKTTGLITATRSTSVNSNAAGAVWVDVFVPCDEMALSAEDAATLAPQYATRASGAATWTAFGSAPTPLSVQGGALASVGLTNVCGSGGGLSKTEVSVSAMATSATWDLLLTPPTGVSAITNAMLVDTLPPGTISVSSWPPAASTASYNFDAFDFYRCDFSGVFAGQFTAAQFLAQRDTRCRIGTSTPTDTHVVMFAANFEAAEGEALGNVAVRFTTVTGTAWGDDPANFGARLTNHAYFNGATLYGALGDVLVEATNEDSWESAALSDPMPNLDSSVAVAPWTKSDFVDANDGTGFVNFQIRGVGRYPVNPSFKIESLSPGATMTSISYTASECETPVPPGTIPVGPYSAPVEFTIGSTANPWRLAPYVDGCSNSYLRVNFMVDGSYPYIDRQTVAFRITSDADNAIQTDTATSSVPVRVTTGMDVQLTATCWEAALDPHVPTPPAAGLGLFHAVAVNRGSDDLNDIELRFTMPAGATFVAAMPGADFPVGGVLQVSRNNGSIWSPVPGGPDATVTDVRVAGFSIEGLGVSALRPSFYVGVAPNNTGVVIGSAWMETATNGLGRTPLKETPFEACTGTVTIEKFFDADADGARDDGEVTLGAGFVFALDGDGTIMNATTGGDGIATFTGVPEGTWSVVESATPPIQGTWQATSGAVQATVVKGAVTALVFGNTCACPTANKCQVGTCAASGACTYTNLPDGQACGDGDACGGQALCEAGQCVTQPPLDCDDQDICTVDACAGGGCDNKPKTCDGGTTTYYTPVVNAAGVVQGAFVCTVIGDKVECKMQGEVLAIDPDHGTTCGN